MYRLKFNKRVRKQEEKLRSSKNKSLKNNIRNVLDELRNNPFSGCFEALSITNPGYFSRKVSRGDRVVYSVDVIRHVVVVVSIVGHYCDNGGRLG